jgi:hypothetical protein
MFRGTERPKLVNVIVSLKTRMARNGRGTDAGTCENEPPGFQKRLGQIRGTRLEPPLVIIPRS